MASLKKLRAHEPQVLSIELARLDLPPRQDSSTSRVSALFDKPDQDSSTSSSWHPVAQDTYVPAFPSPTQPFHRRYKTVDRLSQRQKTLQAQRAQLIDKVAHLETFKVSSDEIWAKYRQDRKRLPWDIALCVLGTLSLVGIVLGPLYGTEAMQKCRNMRISKYLLDHPGAYEKTMVSLQEQLAVTDAELARVVLQLQLA